MNCEKCDRVLVDAIGQRAIRTTSGQTVIFRRTTDYLLCEGCNTLYSVIQIRAANADLELEIDAEATALPLFGAFPLPA